jgi:hypothetical protein
METCLFLPDNLTLTENHLSKQKSPPIKRKFTAAYGELAGIGRPRGRKGDSQNGTHKDALALESAGDIRFSSRVERNYDTRRSPAESTRSRPTFDNAAEFAAAGASGLP